MATTATKTMTTTQGAAAPSAERGAVLRRRALSALAAASLYGLWAFFANHEHGVARALTASATQLGMSFVLAFSMVCLMDRLFRIPQRLVARVLLAWVGAVSLTAVLSVGVHLAVGTPSIGKTVALSMTLGTTLNLLYSLGLACAAKRSGEARKASDADESYAESLLE